MVEIEQAIANILHKCGQAKWEKATANFFKKTDFWCDHLIVKKEYTIKLYLPFRVILSSFLPKTFADKAFLSLYNLHLTYRRNECLWVLISPR